MKYVYLLESCRCPDEHYAGITTDIDKRLKNHNAGQVPHTCKRVPWKLVLAVQFQDDSRAAGFERYLKAGSGRAFANRHFW